MIETKPFEELSPSGRWRRLHPEKYNTEECRKKRRDYIKEWNKKRDTKIGIPHSTVWYRKYPERGREMSRNFKLKNPDYDKQYKIENRNTLGSQWRNRTKIEKLAAFQIVSGEAVPRCRNCGCADLRILEMEHKNGHGLKVDGNAVILRRNIIAGRRKTDDLEILCKVCNAKAYVERVFKLSFEVKFKGGD